MKRNIFLISLFLSISLSNFAQNFEIPTNYKLETKEDCIEQESNILAAIDWLSSNLMNQENAKKWKSVSDFLFEWVGKVPYLSVGFGEAAKPAFKDNPEVGFIYVGGYVKYALTTRDFENKSEQNLAGIEAIVNYYNTYRKELKKNSTLEKYAKLQKEGKLREYILKNGEK